MVFLSFFLKLTKFQPDPNSKHYSTSSQKTVTYEQFYNNEKIRVAYGHPPSRSCGGLGGPSGPQGPLGPLGGLRPPLK